MANKSTHGTCLLCRRCGTTEGRIEHTAPFLRPLPAQAQVEAENSLTAQWWPGSISSRGCPSQQSLEFHSQRRWAGPKPETGQGWALLEANQLLHPPQEQHGAGMYLGLGVWLCALGRPPNFSKPCFPTYKTATAISVGELSEPDSGPGAQCPVCWA